MAYPYNTIPSPNYSYGNSPPEVSYNAYYFPPGKPPGHLYVHAEIPTPQPSPAISFNDSPRASSRQRRKRRCDFLTPCLLVLICGFLTFSSVASILFLPDPNVVTVQKVTHVIIISYVISLPATIMNEVLIDRCWQRVVYAALGDHCRHQRDDHLATNLRAANFELWNWIRRLTKREGSFRDIRALWSYGWLRWGTTASIAAIQLSAKFDVGGRPNDNVDNEHVVVERRHLWILAPAVIQCFCILSALGIWGIMPWSLPRKIHEEDLLDRYQPYLNAVPEGSGSIADYDDVARHLERRGYETRTLEKKHRPGIQFGRKLKGTCFGLLAAEVPPVLAFLLMRHMSEHGTSIGLPLLRFGIHLVFLTQNILYLQALDFVIWNLSLEGLCKAAKTRPNNNLRHLSSTSGVMLLIKALKQLKHWRPFRATLYLWLFWIQAVLVRAWMTLFLVDLSMNEYQSDHKLKVWMLDPQFWIGWVIDTGIVIYPLFFLWLLTPFQVPICSPDGWRWANIANGAWRSQGFSKGSYGVVDGKAAWGNDVVSFKEWGGGTLT